MTGNRSGRGRANGARVATGPACSHCGGRLRAAANFCPDCGTPSPRVRDGDGRRSQSASPAEHAAGANAAHGREASPETNGSPDREVLEYRVAEAVANGWRIESDLGDRVVVVRRHVGSPGMHALIALATIWWTMGLGNALYGCYCYLSRAERRVIRADGAIADRDRATETSETSLWRAVLPVATLWLVAGAFLWIGASIGATALGAIALIVAGAFALAGVGATPPIRRRLATRRSILANGRYRSVDERVAFAPADPCSVCAGRIGRGVERTYEETTYLLGLPVTTTDRGRNVYCRTCANAGTGAVHRGDERDSIPPTDRAPTSNRERPDGVNRSPDPATSSGEGDVD